MSTGAGALLLALLIHADPTQTGEILRWLMGSITEDPRRGTSRALGLSGFVLAALTFGVLYASQLNILVFGDDVAAGRGVDVARLRLAVYVMAGVLTAAVVALTGPIGFVGLVIPTRAVS